MKKLEKGLRLRVEGLGLNIYEVLGFRVFGS